MKFIPIPIYYGGSGGVDVTTHEMLLIMISSSVSCSIITILAFMLMFTVGLFQKRYYHRTSRVSKAWMFSIYDYQLVTICAAFAGILIGLTLLLYIGINVFNYFTINVIK